MSNGLRSAQIYESIAMIEAQPGQPLPRYAIPLDRPVLYKWTPGSSSTVNHVTVLGYTSGYAGSWGQIRYNDRGDDLNDVSLTITVAGEDFRVLPASTLTANRTLTLSTTNAVAGDSIEITRLDAGAYTYTIANGGVGGGNVAVLPVSTRYWLRAWFDGVDWTLRAAGTLP